MRVPVYNKSAACDKADPFPRDGGPCYDRRKCLAELERRGQGRQDASRLAALFRNTSMLVLGDSVNLYRAKRLERAGLQRNCGEGLGRAEAEAKGKGVCYHPHNNFVHTWCASEARREKFSQRRDFDVVFWNYGGHSIASTLLPARPITVPGPRGPIQIGTLTTSQEYKEGLETCAKVVSRGIPMQNRLRPHERRVFAELRGTPRRRRATWATKQNDPMYDMQMTSVGVQTLRTHERAMAARLMGQTILDPQNDGLCACTAKGDGRALRRHGPANAGAPRRFGELPAQARRADRICEQVELTTHNLVHVTSQWGGPWGGGVPPVRSQ